MWDQPSQQELDDQQAERDRTRKHLKVHKLLDEARDLLDEAYKYIDNTHGYNSQLFRDIREFLDKSKNV
jgi:hypothetical protein